jgi:predicted nuclease with TOPRIM domain
MKEQLLQRLDELRSEFEAGQKMLAGLETQQIHMKSSLLRISGAIQVLEEFLGQSPPEDQP